MTIEKVEEAVRLTPTDHHRLAGWLNKLGGMLESRYDRTGQMGDLEKAFKKVYEAVSVIRAGHLDQLAMLTKLGNMLECRYKRRGRMADLELAIKKAEEVIRPITIDHHDLFASLDNLGHRQMLSPDPRRTDNTMSSFLSSWHCQSGVPSVRLMSAVAAFDLLVSRKSWNQAADLAVGAISLPPLTDRRMLSQEDQQHVLAVFASLAAMACSLCLDSSRPVEASVKILERGRGAMLTLMIDDRRGISHLHQSCPEEAEEYEGFRKQVNVIPSDNTADD